MFWKIYKQDPRCQICSGHSHRPCLVTAEGRSMSWPLADWLGKGSLQAEQNLVKHLWDSDVYAYILHVFPEYSYHILDTGYEDKQNQNSPTVTVASQSSANCSSPECLEVPTTSLYPSPQSPKLAPMQCLCCSPPSAVSCHFSLHFCRQIPFIEEWSILKTHTHLSC